MKEKYKCLIVDDEVAICKTLSFHLEDNNYKTSICHSGKDALNFIDNNYIDIVISDVRMKDMSGLELLKKIKKVNKNLPVIIITAYGNIELAVKSIKSGADDFLTKPFKIEQLFVSIQNVLEKKQLQMENILFKNQFTRKIKIQERLIGSSPQIKKIKRIIKKVSDTNSVILITGESGTGKEVVTKEIFINSSRNDKPYYALNCTAIPSNLIESELFGYVKGAFTGAYENKKGIIEIVRGGTLFLDEICDLPMESQGKLLRLLENKEFFPVGSTKKIEADFRLIAATNKNPHVLITKNKFREDLYYRISVIEINIPPLRERKEDIIPLTRHFITCLSKEMKKKPPELSEKIKDQLLNYNYPGNIRELKNIIERMVIFNKEDLIEDINILKSKKFNAILSDNFKDGNSEFLPLKEIERKYILEVLKSSDNNKEKTAKTLGITRKTLWSKLKKYNISSE